jgi:hypothetical protein
MLSLMVCLYGDFCAAHFSVAVLHDPHPLIYATTISTCDLLWHAAYTLVVLGPNGIDAGAFDAGA